MVANWESGVGYAWWLMEGFWVSISENYSSIYTPIIAYPKITRTPDSIKNSKALIVEHEFNTPTLLGLINNCKLIKDHRIRVIYLSDRSDLDWRYLVYRLFGVKKILIHDHTPGVRPSLSYAKRLLKGILRRIPWVTVDAAIGATDFVQQRLISTNRLPAHKCFSASNGLPSLADDLTPVDIHREFHIHQHKKIMVMTGRAHRYKGVPFALQCIALLKIKSEAYPHFLFVGDGPHLDEFKQLADELGIAEDCTFAGRRNDVPEILESCDIAIHPSEGEVGYSLSILEYMRAGLPVIVPDDPSVCGATQHNVNGLIYKKGDIQAAALAIRALLTDESLLIRLGENAEKDARKYTIKDTHKALLNAFNKTLSSKIYNLS